MIRSKSTLQQSLHFKKRLILVVIIISGGLGGLIWLALKPTYEFYYYKLNSCENTYLTAIIYWKVGERGVILARGKHREIPTNNYIIFRDLSGFDAYLHGVATCEKNIITINTNTSFFDPDIVSDDILPKVVDSETYKGLRNSETSVFLEFY